MAERKRKITIADIIAMKREGRKIVSVTAYDYPSALIADKAEVDIILVGDSGGMVVLGHPDTRPVTMDEMLIMCRAVSRGSSHALLVGDMPFMSYQASVEEGLRNAGRFIKEGGMDAIKIEGGLEQSGLVRGLSNAGIPVMAHIGFTPQSTPVLHGYRVQGKTAESAQKLLENALALQEAGAFSVVLEMVTSEAAEMISRSLHIPTIGIGSGIQCDGQVLVLHDILGLYDKFTPKFAKKYRNLAAEILAALEEYRNDVFSKTFPGDEHSFHMTPEEFQKLAPAKRKS